MCTEISLKNRGKVQKSNKFGSNNSGNKLVSEFQEGKTEDKLQKLRLVDQKETASC